MNQSNIIVRIIIAIVCVAAAFLVIGVLAPLFSGIDPKWVNAVTILLKILAVAAGVLYAVSGRSIVS